MSNHLWIFLVKGFRLFNFQVATGTEKKNAPLSSCVMWPSLLHQHWCTTNCTTCIRLYKYGTHTLQENYKISHLEKRNKNNIIDSKKHANNQQPTFFSPEKSRDICPPSPPGHWHHVRIQAWIIHVENCHGIDASFLPSDYRCKTWRPPSPRKSPWQDGWIDEQQGGRFIYPSIHL